MRKAGERCVEVTVKIGKCGRVQEILTEVPALKTMSGQSWWTAVPMQVVESGLGKYVRFIGSGGEAEGSSRWGPGKYVRFIGSRV
jgi:hypothetical protein